MSQTGRPAPTGVGRLSAIRRSAFLRLIRCADHARDARSPSEIADARDLMQTARDALRAAWLEERGML